MRKETTSNVRGGGRGIESLRGKVADASRMNIKRELYNEKQERWKFGYDEHEGIHWFEG